MKGKGVAVFVSQPMRDRSKEAIEGERKRLFDELPNILGVERYLEIPMLSELECAMNNPAHCLGSSIQDMSHSDIVVFLPGWRDARGCVIEHAVCMMYRIPYVELGDGGSGYFIIRDERGRWS